MTLVEKLARVKEMIQRTRGGGINALWIQEAIDHIEGNIVSPIEEALDVNIDTPDCPHGNLYAKCNDCAIQEEALSDFAFDENRERNL